MPDRIDTIVESRITPTSEIARGICAIAPILLGVLPFALVTGVMSHEVGLSTIQALGMSVIVFAGASQLAAMELIRGQAPLAIVLLTGLVINLRFTIYSASLAPHFRHVPRRWRPALAYVLSDQAYAVSIGRFGPDAPPRRGVWFYTGAALSVWLIWQAGTIAGLSLGASLPDSWALDFAVELTFIALLVPAVTDKATAAAAAAGGLASLAMTAILPLNLGLVTGVLVGVLTGVAVERTGSR